MPTIEDLLFQSSRADRAEAKLEDCRSECYEATENVKYLSRYVMHRHYCPVENSPSPPQNDSPMCICGLSQLLDPGLE